MSFSENQEELFAFYGSKNINKSQVPAKQKDFHSEDDKIVQKLVSLQKFMILSIFIIYPKIQHSLSA